MRCIAFSILFLGLFVGSVKAQACNKDALDFFACKQIEALRSEFAAASNTERGKLDGINNRLDTLNNNLSTLIKLLQDSNSNTSSTITKLTETSTQLRQQNEQANELLQNLIIERFKSLPADLLVNPLFKSEIDKLKNDILKEVEKRKP